MSICGNILANTDLTASCGPVGGIGKTIYVFNWDELSFGYSTTGDVTGITFKSGCFKGYKVTTRHDANQTAEDMALVNGAPLFNQTVTLRGAVDGPEPRWQLNNLAKAERLLVVAQENGDNTNRYKVYGLSNGLRTTAFSLASNQNAADLSGFEMGITGTTSDIAPYLLPTSQTTPALQEAYLDGLTVGRVTAGITSVLQGEAGYQFSTGDTITVRGCGFTGATSVVLGGRTFPTTSTAFNGTLTVVNDTTITLTVGSGEPDGTTTNTAVTVNRPVGNLTYTNPSTIAVSVTSV